MLQIFVRLMIVLAIMVATLALIGSLLPRRVAYQVAHDFPASPATVFEYFVDLQKWPSWTSWNRQDKPFLQITLGPITRGVGASQTWNDPRGSGKLWISAATPPSEVEYRIRFGSFPEFVERVELTPLGNGTRVTWSGTGRLPAGPFFGFFRPFFTRGLSSAYAENLKRLEKELGLQTPPAAASAPAAAATGSESDK